MTQLANVAEREFSIVRVLGKGLPALCSDASTASVHLTCPSCPKTTTRRKASLTSIFSRLMLAASALVREDSKLLICTYAASSLFAITVNYIYNATMATLVT